jgi:hypothetical protein
VSENRANLRKANLQLFTLLTVAWLIHIAIESDPPGVYVVRFSLKWFVYTYTLIAIVSVLAPHLAVLPVGLVVSKLRFGQTNYCQVYRWPFMGAVI